MTKVKKWIESKIKKPKPEYDEAKREFEKGYLSQILHQAKGSVTQAAKITKQHRGDLYRLMKKHGFKAEDFK